MVPRDLGLAFFDNALKTFRSPQCLQESWNFNVLLSNSATSCRRLSCWSAKPRTRKRQKIRRPTTKKADDKKAAEDKKADEKKD